MRSAVTAAITAACFFVSSHAAVARHHHYEPAKQQQYGWTAPQPQKIAYSRHYTRHHAVAVVHRSPADNKLKLELSDLRREIDDLRQRIGPRSWEGAGVPFVEREGDGGYRLASLPDMRQPLQEPAAPVVVSSDDSLVAAALAYLKSTAVPGYTMTRQGPDVALGRLHPAFVMRLAEAIRWAREHGLPHAGIYSAYRPPAFGVGGFGNKFFSMHSYGLAADMTGIGGPGAHIWQNAVQIAGLYLPYGVNNRAEFNHTQLLSSKMAWMALRRTITASAPKNLREMWMASGVKAYVPAEPPRDVAGK